MRAVAGGAYANIEASRVLRNRGFSGRDAGLVTELVYGSIRMRSLYDRIIAAAANRPPEGIEERVLDVLRLGVHQLLAMRVPAHAAVDESVAMARDVAGLGASTLVNAVLRRVSEQDRSAWLDLVVPAGEGLPALAVRHSHPEWVVRALRAALVGHRVADAATVDAELEVLLASDNEAPVVSLVARPGLVEESELLAAGALPGRWAETAYLMPEGNPGAIAAVREGRAGVQDEGSQLVALAVARAVVTTEEIGGRELDRGATADAAEAGPETGERWLDLCAGPGGKAGLLAALALQRGATLVANEVSEHRAALVRQTLSGALARGASVRVEVEDGRRFGELQPAAFDRVLVDAPCTGLGALRRRPEARWRRQPSDLPALTSLQRELLTSAIDACRAGGVVVYATCSPHLSETRFLVADAVRRRPDVVLEDARALLRDREGQVLPDLGEGPFAQLWPHRHGTDGMFVALLRRG